MQPEIDILGLELKTFGICFGLGFVVSGAIVARRLGELGRPVDWAYEMLFAAMLGGLVGSRVYWLAENPDEIDDFGGLFSGSGLVWYGGLIGGAIGVLAWAWRRGILNRGLLDLAAVPLAMGQAIGRVGCQLAGDGDYGGPTDLPWGMAYPDGVVPTDVDVHPTPIYETVALGMTAWVLWRGRDTLRPGLLFPCYLVLAGLMRFAVEFVRINEEQVVGLTTAQLLSMAMIAAGGAWLAVVHRRDGGIRRAPGAAAAATI